jgi:hypothetical protein
VRPRFSAPITDVVMPLECQSIPMTAPNDWNQNGLASRLRNSSRPYSRTTASVMTAPSFAIRPASHSGTRPPCSGRSALPARCVIPEQ